MLLLLLLSPLTTSFPRPDAVSVKPANSGKQTSYQLQITANFANVMFYVIVICVAKHCMLNISFVFSSVICS